jgi:hypothetical protein
LDLPLRFDVVRAGDQDLTAHDAGRRGTAGVVDLPGHPPEQVNGLQQGEQVLVDRRQCFADDHDDAVRRCPPHREEEREQ